MAPNADIGFLHFTPRDLVNFNTQKPLQTKT